MTYADLLATLKGMTPEQLSKDLTIHTIGENYPAYLMVSTEDDEVLGANHPYFKVEGEQ